MVNALCLQVGFVCQFGSFERPKVHLLSSVSNLRGPSSLVLGNAKKVRCGSSHSSAHVSTISRAAYFAQVFKPVVCSDAVDVVDEPGRPASVHIQPCESMAEVALAINANPGVSILLSARCNLPGLDPVARNGFPCEDAGIQIVGKKRAQPLRQKTRIFVAHARCSNTARLWEVTSLACKPMGSRHFIRSR